MMQLSGTIIQEEGFYVSRCVELEISTCGRSLEEAMSMTKDMLLGYFEVARQIGSLGDVVSKLDPSARYPLQAGSELPAELAAAVVARFKYNDSVIEEQFHIGA
jgi:predicted RNase H-like HicB family nuclease